MLGDRDDAVGNCDRYYEAITYADGSDCGLWGLGCVPARTIGAMSSVLGVADALPIGAVPGVGQGIGAALDWAAFLAAGLAIELSNCDEFTQGVLHSANMTNLLAGQGGNALSTAGNIALSVAEAQLLAGSERILAACG